MQELTFEQVESVSGGSCTYAGKSYSEGSRMEQAGAVMVCKGGEWLHANEDSVS